MREREGERVRERGRERGICVSEGWRLAARTCTRQQASEAERKELSLPLARRLPNCEANCFTVWNQKQFVATWLVSHNKEQNRDKTDLEETKVLRLLSPEVNRNNNGALWPGLVPEGCRVCLASVYLCHSVDIHFLLTKSL